MKATEAAWLAGIVDGEGCFSCVGGTTVMLSVGMTHEITIDRIQEIFPANRWVMRTANGYRDQHVWNVSFKKGLKGLTKRLLPYLVTKRRQAEVTLEFEKTMTGGRKLTPKAWEKRTRLIEELATLNRRGPQ